MGYDLEEVKGRHHRQFVDPAQAASSEYSKFWGLLRLQRDDTDCAGSLKEDDPCAREFVW